jgi:Membrane bound O-acyl transferase family
MWALSLAIFAALKWMTWWAKRRQLEPTPARSLAYLLAWPGMDAEAFLDPGRRARRPEVCEWLWAAAKTAGGTLLLWVIARRVPADRSLLRGWTGLLGLVFLLHFGSFHLLALFWQSQGVDARPIMSNPIAAKSLGEFWGRRWNLGFRQLAHDFVFRPIERRSSTTVAGLAVFVTSGLLHDLVISFPAHGGYGLPTGYFLLQAIAVIFERSKAAVRMRLTRDFRGQGFTLLVTAGPVFWLFHPSFVQRVIVPFMRAIHAL